jgi:uncharacterized protein (TIGR03083 family)
MDEITAFLTALDRTDPDAPTRCAEWSAHDLLAHLVAGTEEMLQLTELAIADEPSSATRPFEERERPWRAVPDPELRLAFLDVGARFLAALDTASQGLLVPFTGWSMTTDDLRRHGRTELAIHRWDLVGDDATSAQLLSQPDLIEHSRTTLRSMPALFEARRRPGAGEDVLTMWGRGRRRQWAILDSNQRPLPCEGSALAN